MRAMEAIMAIRDGESNRLFKVTGYPRSGTKKKTYKSCYPG